MIQELLLQLITLIHILFILFVLAPPFINSNYFLLLHIIVIPFLILHWITNDNNCILTILEKNLRNMKSKKDEEDCFMCKLIEPIYDVNKNYSRFSSIIYVTTIGLWIVSMYKLFYGYKVGTITKWTDLFII